MTGRGSKGRVYSAKGALPDAFPSDRLCFSRVSREPQVRETSPWDRMWSSPAPPSSNTPSSNVVATLLGFGVPGAAAVLDAGCGDSDIIPALLKAGFTDVSAVDISPKALDESRRRIGPAADLVKWIPGDVLTVTLPPERFDVWIDRALFHFFILPEERSAYIRQMLRSVKKGGILCVSSFNEDGPELSYGLHVVRRSPEALAEEFSDGFSLAGVFSDTFTDGSGSWPMSVCILRKD